MVEILGNQVDVEEREALSAIGSIYTSIINIFKTLMNYGYLLAQWLIHQLQENPFRTIAFALDMTILMT